MDLKPGAKLRSVVCTTEVIVVRAPVAAAEIECGGATMVPVGEPFSCGSIDPALAEGTVIGKRYLAEDVGLEVLCTKPGAGSLRLDGEPLPMKDAKPLPASD